ncbi:dienelactone hydrolase family protein CYBJADRAFT_173583 [Cyberlindnera jadinii NRRL Y-1542]|uniref:Dienelactone hydrolase domain-containing protein n=1 Tax=Cyberlindnera jadinii (strain ATCC 18201 / CBS 1600 / BCRC 20928 / JCM 3617 / NBRC 0987 / NRRL Y-1542) TaxID=983966 RepID=A0A1E4S0R9_CYBJN|nr:hypothetical protein CYBJADRAFT_173583 [Cyberlindnera jadinii NRRL Y-1542]ODV73071.1 hypothetical protein CYBJADRAFT_173583 [Cyberlindnera jadinii NRRL Y-1542]
MEPDKDLEVPQSAYPRMFREFDSSFQNIDDVEGDISLRVDAVGHGQYDGEGLDAEDDSSFDDMLDPSAARRGSVFGDDTPVNGSSTQMFKEVPSPRPRGYEFRLKSSKCNVYLTYPSNSVEIDTYGRVEYELKTKENSMVVILPNSKGLSVNNKKLADAYAIRTGCVTAVVDIYFDDPLNLETPAEDAHDSSFISKVKSLTVGVAVNVKLNYWLQCHNVFGAYNDGKFQTTSNWLKLQGCIDELLTTLKTQNAILIGFSYGANAVARIAIESEDPRIKATAIVHPIFMPQEVCETIKIPTLFIVGREDSFYSLHDLEKFEKDLASKKDKKAFKFVQLKFHNDTPHGFAIAGDYSPMKIGDLPSRTCEQITSWVLRRI